MTIPRWLHRWYAFLFGYFWIPCPSCGRMFGGHEAYGGTFITHETARSRSGRILCANCPDDRYALDEPSDDEVTRRGPHLMDGRSESDRTL